MGNVDGETGKGEGRMPIAETKILRQGKGRGKGKARGRAFRGCPPVYPLDEALIPYFTEGCERLFTGYNFIAVDRMDGREERSGIARFYSDRKLGEER